MPKPDTLPGQALERLPQAATDHMPQDVPPSSIEASFVFGPDTLPEQALDHIPGEFPPPEQALGRLPEAAQDHIPDFPPFDTLPDQLLEADLSIFHDDFI